VKSIFDLGKRAIMEASADDFHKVPGPQVIRSIAAHFEDRSISQQVIRTGSCVILGYTLKKETINWCLDGFQRKRGGRKVFICQ
jgi:hypothetical protein